MTLATRSSGHTDDRFSDEAIKTSEMSKDTKAVIKENVKAWNNKFDDNLLNKDVSVAGVP